MDLQERLSHLENVRDWQGLVEELEKSAAAGTNEEKARIHLRLGQILEGKFLAGVKALKHFQDAYKLNPAAGESLARARSIYWDLGKLNMVQKLLELELKSQKEGPVAAALLLELGDVLCDVGDYDRATSTYAKAVQQGDPTGQGSACLEDVQVESGSWQAHVAQLVRGSLEAQGAARGRLLLRAARIAKRFAPEEVEGLLQRAYAADPESKQIAALFEGALVDAARLLSLIHI